MYVYFREPEGIGGINIGIRQEYGTRTATTGHTVTWSSSIYSAW
jgi:hypothetical protein